MNERDNVISMEDYKKKKSREAVILFEYEDCEAWNRPAPHPTPEQILSLIEASPRIQARVHVKAPQPKPWYHWYTEQR